MPRAGSMWCWLAVVSGTTLLNTKVREEAAPIARLPVSGDDVKYLDGVLSKFQNFAQANGVLTKKRHDAQQEKLRGLLAGVHEQDAQLALQQAVMSNGEAEVEASAIFGEMSRFIGSMRSILGRQGCGDLQCGANAVCSRTTRGAECVCSEGYEGDGKTCTAPAAFAPTHLLHGGPHGRQPQVADVRLAELKTDGNSMIMCVFRDLSKKNHGMVKVGKTLNMELTWAPLEKFSGGTEAWNPDIVGVREPGKPNRVVITWRDQDVGGTGWIRVASVGHPTIRGADLALTWGKPQAFEKKQQKRAVLLALPYSRFLIFYEGHDGGASFGGVMMARVNQAVYDTSHGAPSWTKMKQFRFCETAVSRISAASLDNGGFVVAYRGAPVPDPNDAAVQLQAEASLSYGRVVEEITSDGRLNPANAELAVGIDSVQLDNATAGIWSRDVAPVAPNTVAYAYHVGESQETKLAVVRVVSDGADSPPRLVVSNEPEVIGIGFTPYVSVVPLPYTSDDLHSMVLFQPAGSDRKTEAKANICSLTDDGKIERGTCEDFGWSDRELKSVSVASLGAGRELFAFTDSENVPYYQALALAKKP
mmetsp:Transcript_21616/g.52717  ORF Transcript_21616/g.52717 Transcript_21616/m.52717 type:complete len:589 (+) Transcript_21616:142-1908(+)